MNNKQGKQVRMVIHVEMREPINNLRHFYFGSKSAIYSVLSEAQLGVKPSTLKNITITPEAPYINKQCTIRKGELVTSLRNNSKND